MSVVVVTQRSPPVDTDSSTLGRLVVPPRHNCPHFNLLSARKFPQEQLMCIQPVTDLRFCEEETKQEMAAVLSLSSIRSLTFLPFTSPSLPIPFLFLSFFFPFPHFSPLYIQLYSPIYMVAEIRKKERKRGGPQ